MQERPDAQTLVPPDYKPIGNAKLIEQHDCGATFKSGSTTIEITALAADLFRVGMFANGHSPNYESEAVAKRDWSPESVNVHDGGECLWISTHQVHACVELEPCRIGFEDIRSRRFAEDDPELGMGTLPQPWSNPLLPNVLGPPVRLYKRRPTTERYFACGERTGGLEKTESHQVFWNVDPPKGHTAAHDNLYTSFPFVLALDQGKAWGLFLDNSHRSEFDLAREHPERSWFGADGGDLVYYVFAGPAPKDVVERYTELTGRTPLPPLWALGNHQSRWGYDNTERVREIAREFRERDIPCDALYLDIDYMDGYRVFTWDEERFPDPSGLANELREQGFHLVTIVDPGVKADEEYSVYTDGRANDLFCKTADGSEYQNVVWPGVCAFPDFTSARTREWWSELHKALFDAGIAGLWYDMNEPSVFIPRDSTIPPDIVHPGDGKPKIHAEVHNLYGMLMARAGSAAFERFRPEHRPFVISRSGFSGLQRYAMHWTGDNSSWWEHLWMSMPQLQNLGLSGLAWAGVDVGGFWGDTNAELLARWTEFGAFQPFCRNHSAVGTRSQEPWAFGEPYESVIRDMLKLRQRLIPYLYTLFDACQRSGAPVLRPLLFEYPDDERTYAADDQFLLGESLLIAPITNHGKEHRHVYLPAGTWCHWWRGERFDGPIDILAHAPLGQPAIYVKANRAIPLWPEMNHANERPADPLMLRIHPADGHGEFTLYEDAGEGFGYQQGEYARTTITCAVTSDGITVTIGEREGSYRPQRTRVELELRALEGDIASVLVNGEAWDQWQFRDGVLSVSLPDTSEARTIAVHR